MSKKCKECGSIDYGLLGYLGLVGFSMIIGGMFYALSQFTYITMIYIIEIRRGKTEWKRNKEISKMFERSFSPFIITTPKKPRTKGMNDLWANKVIVFGATLKLSLL